MGHVLKPNSWKILLALTLFVIASILWRMYVISRISDTFPWGFPLQFYLGWGPCRPGEVCSEFNGLFLILDLMIWYVASAFIVNRVQKRS